MFRYISIIYIIWRLVIKYCMYLLIIYRVCSLAIICYCGMYYDYIMCYYDNVMCYYDNVMCYSCDL